MSAFDTTTSATAGQQWNAQDYAIDAGFVPLLGGAVSRLLDPRAGEHMDGATAGAGDQFSKHRCLPSGLRPQHG
ncbi:TPA: hypothetical protein R1S83_005731, partial [Klebsiella pneumoniae]|nr:hypothetical protein [Klebsiella pneumoniae]